MNLYEKLVIIMSEMGTVAKNGKNEFDNYSYVKESDVSEKLQGLLVKNQVFVFSSIENSKSQQVTSSQGKPNILSTVHIKYTFVNAENPEEKFEVYSAGDGMDRGDKAIYKAITGAHKYFMIRNFNLGSDDDAEKDSPGINANDEIVQGKIYDDFGL